MKIAVRLQGCLTSLCMAIVIVAAASSSSLGEELPIPHLTGNATDWQDMLLVDNLDDTEKTFTLRLYASGVELYMEHLDVAPFTSVRYDLKTLAPGAQCGLIRKNEGDDLLFRLAFESVVGGGAAEFALQDNRDTVLGFFFTDFSPNLDWKGAGMANLGEDDATVTLYAVGAGAILGTATIDIPALSNVSAVHTGWFPGVPFDAMKQIIAVSDEPVTGLVISGAKELDALLFTLADEDVVFDLGGMTPQPASTTGGAQ